MHLHFISLLFTSLNNPWDNPIAVNSYKYNTKYTHGPYNWKPPLIFHDCDTRHQTRPAQMCQTSGIIVNLK